MERETDDVRAMLATLVQAGLRRVMLGNLGHLPLVRAHALVTDGDFRLNVTNRETVAVLERMGFSTLLLSPELTLPQIRDLTGPCSVIVYGRIPLMTLEKCVGRELGSCEDCTAGALTLRDRRGAEFPVLREWEHRSVICNSLPTSMSDRQDRLLAAGITGGHFLFTTETAEEVDRVLNAFRDQLPLPHPVRRIN